MSNTKYHIGCSGFYNKHWKGIFYPQDLPQNKWFGFYCEHFNSLELNVTFYRFPSEKLLSTWWIKSPDNFRISVKAPRLITHLKKFNDCETLLDDFYTACETGLKSKLGAVLFQLPPSIHYSEEMLEKICQSLRRGFTNVIEFRHQSWWDPKVLEMLRAFRIVFCTVSHPELPNEIVVNSSVAYVRLHGIPEMFYSAYTSGQLRQLKDRIDREPALEEVYIYFNNTAGDAGIMNARELKKMLQQ